MGKAVAKVRRRKIEKNKSSSVILLDSAHGRTTEIILRAGIDALNAAARHGEQDMQALLQLRTFTFEELLPEVINSFCDANLILIAVTENVLSVRKDAQNRNRIPCPSSRVAQAIRPLLKDRLLFLVNATNPDAFTGVDVASALAIGVDGVVDERALIRPDVLDQMMRIEVTDRRFKYSVVLGESAIRLHAIKSMIETWSQDELSSSEHDFACWRTGSALGQIGELVPIVGAGDRPYSYLKIADTINLEEQGTNFRLARDDLRKVISTLCRRWLGELDEGKNRLRLPEYARQNGFPANPPAIVGLAYDEVIRRIYRFLTKMQVNVNYDGVGLAHAQVKMELTEFRRIATLPRRPKS